MVFLLPSCQPNRVSQVSRWFFSSWDWLLDRPGLSFEEIRKRKLFAILIVPGVLILFSFAVHHLIHRNLVEGLLDLWAGVWLLASLAILRVLKRGLVVYRLNTVMLGLLFVFLAVRGGVHGNKLMWVFSFPLIAFYTLGKAEGAIWTVAILLLLLGVLYVPVDLVSVHAYAQEFKLRFCVAFFFVSTLTYIYESVREHSQTGLEEANRALKLSEERLKRAQAIARVGNLEYDIHSGMVWGSEEALRILGIDASRSMLSPSILKPLIPDFDALFTRFEATRSARCSSRCGC
jgi:PAS domain-containing protein